MDEPMLSDAAHVNGTAAVGTADGSDSGHAQDGTNNTGDTGAERGALRPAFMSGLATAMREAAVRERARITSAVAEDAATHVEKVRSRAAIESEELRRLAEEDVEHIEQWSSSEIERIRTEATQKVDDRRSSLDDYLKQHDSIIETEIEGVDRAVRDYETTLDQFFAQLAEITDPSEIVRRAGQLPAPPDLDDIRATARANAMARFTESDSGADEPAERTEAVAEPVEAIAEGEAPSEPAQAIAAEAGAQTSEAGDDGTMAGVMDDGAGSVEPGESIESTVDAAPPAAEEAPAVVAAAASGAPAGPAAEPVGVMDPDAQRVPNWPAPAPNAPAAPIAPTIDNTSAAVRLLRSVAPWTAPTHAGNRTSNDSE